MHSVDYFSIIQGLQGSNKLSFMCQIVPSGFVNI